MEQDDFLVTIEIAEMVCAQERTHSNIYPIKSWASKESASLNQCYTSKITSLSQSKLFVVVNKK